MTWLTARTDATVATDVADTFDQREPGSPARQRVHMHCGASARIEKRCATRRDPASLHSTSMVARREAVPRRA
jgi:hypothetical protein